MLGIMMTGKSYYLAWHTKKYKSCGSTSAKNSVDLLVFGLSLLVHKLCWPELIMTAPNELI